MGGARIFSTTISHFSRMPLIMNYFAESLREIRLKLIKRILMVRVSRSSQ